MLNKDIVKRLMNEDKLVENPVVNSKLTLTTDPYQITNMENNTTISLPVVDKFTEIHLYFDTTSELTLILPNIKWQSDDISIEANKSYEFIFTYTNKWLGGVISYE